MATDDSPDDALLRRYLLGLTSAEDTERIDELSVTSDELSTRLQALEYDLFDAYARGELAGEELAAFRASYPAHADGRAEITFAETLLRRQTRSSPQPAPEQPAPQQPAPGRTAAAPVRRGWWSSDSFPRWTLAFAATLILAVAAYLVIDNQSLRHDVDGARAERAALEDRERTLRKQLADQRAADEETTRELARLRNSLAALEQHGSGGGTTPAAAATVIASFLLPPATRGAGDMPTITLPPGPDVVRLQLPLEGDRGTTFSAAIRDATTNQIVWKGGGLRPVAGRERRTLVLTVPAMLLKPRTYLIELSSMGTGGGAAEALSPYAFQVVIP